MHRTAVIQPQTVHQQQPSEAPSRPGDSRLPMKRRRGGYGVRIETGEGDRMGCFASGAWVTEFTLSLTWAVHCWQRLANRLGAERGEEKHQMCHAGSDCMHSDSQWQEQRHPSGLLAALPSTFKSEVSCARGHPAHADWRGLRRSQHLTTQLQDAMLNLTCVCVLVTFFFPHLFTWFQSVSEDRKWVISGGPEIQAVLSLRLPNANLPHTWLR